MNSIKKNKKVSHSVSLSSVLFCLAAFATWACTRCPESEYGNLLEQVADPKTKNEGVDLKGWTYEKAVSTKSGQTHYYYHLPSEAPGKPTFVLLHGLIFDGRNFLEWKPLAKHFELIAYDFPNESDFYRGRTDDFAELLNDFLMTLKIEKTYLGGVSLGGQIAMIFASKKRSVALSGLLLLSTDTAKNERELRSSKRLAKTTARITGRDASKTLCIITKQLKKKQEEGGEKMRYLDNLALKKVDFYNQVLDTSIDMKKPIPLQSIRVPTLIVHGDEDSVISIDDAKELPEHIPDSTFEVIPGGEHVIAYSHAEEIVRFIEKRFVTGTPPEK
jgi:pimeloyl-ACP methyl ester carboxylesterase